MNSISQEVELLQEKIKSWQIFSKDQIKFERLSGSLSNFIWKVTALSAEVQPKTVILRKFGQVSDVLDRDRENHIFAELSKLKLGPAFYGVSTEYRIEEFYENDPMVRSDIRVPHIRRALAKDLSKFHSAKISGIEKNPFILKVLRDGIFDKDFESKILTAEFNESEEIMYKEIKSVVSSKEERDFLINLLPTATSSIVFSHNDFHTGNILCLKDKNSFLLIDCEYNDYNYRAFDIATLFIEAMLDYSKPAYPFYAVNEEEYPPTSELEEFVKYYVFYKMFPEKAGDEAFFEKALLDQLLLDEYVRESGRIEFYNEIDQVLLEAEVCKMLSHFYYAIWSVVFSKKPEIKFDYISWGLDRLKLYKQAKKEFMERKSASPRGNTWTVQE